MRAVATAWGVALLIGWCLVLGSVTDEPDRLCPNVRLVERSALETDLRAWPPGVVECNYMSPAGKHVRTTHFLWREWLATVLFASALATWVLALTTPSRRARLGGAGATLCVLAFLALLVAV